MSTEFIEEQILKLAADDPIRPTLIKLRILGSGDMIPEDILDKMMRDILHWVATKNTKALEIASLVLTVAINALSEIMEAFPFKICEDCPNFDECQKVIHRNNQSQLDTSKISVEHLATVIGEC